MEKISYVCGKEYIIEKKIYENKLSQTCVMLVQDCKLKRRVILKRILFQNEEQKMLILKEIENQVAIGRFSDFVPQIHNIYCDKQQKEIYIEMQHIDGKSLREIIIEKKSLRRDKTFYDDSFHMIVHICQVMSNVHDLKGCVHKDLKPENILVNRKKKAVYVIDFGISGPGIMNKGVGTERYMAPEQRQNVKGLYVTQATDVFAIGQIAIELLTGETLLFDKDLIFNPRGEKWEEEKDISHIGGEHYPELGKVISKALAMKPQDRYVNARAFYEALIAGKKANYGYRKQKFNKNIK